MNRPLQRWEIYKLVDSILLELYEKRPIDSNSSYFKGRLCELNEYVMMLETAE